MVLAKVHRENVEDEGRSKNVKVFYGESSEEEKKKPKFKPKMTSPPKKRKIKVCCLKSS